MSSRKKLKELVAAKRGVIVPGAFNALSARVIADLGFEALYSRCWPGMASSPSPTDDPTTAWSPN